MEANSGPVRHARLFVVSVSLLLLLVTAASLYVDLRGSDQQYEILAAEVARSFFQAIDAVRDWNLRQGGIYVRESPETQPNIFLPPALRELVSPDGVRMAMISHAQMTRLLSEVLTEGRGIHLHITSLAPVRTENKPEEWEKSALRKFEEGSRDEFYQVGKSADRTTFQYMAPLKTGAVCYSCHERKDIPERMLGGMSVSFDYGPFLRVQGIQDRRAWAAHLIFMFFGLVFAGVMGSKLLGSIRALQDSTARIKRLEGLLPICANCKKVRLEGADYKRQDSWIAVEQYIEARTDAEFTHGLCPDCATKLYPEIQGKNSRRGAADAEK
jgi:hypothetical protein